MCLQDVCRAVYIKAAATERLFHFEREGRRVDLPSERSRGDLHNAPRKYFVGKSSRRCHRTIDDSSIVDIKS